MMQVSRHRRWVVAGSILAVLGWLALAGRGNDPETPPGEAQAADRERPLDAEVVVACTARVEAAGETIDVGAGMDGVVAALRVSEGDRVRAGDVLAVIDRRELGAELSAAKSAAEAARQMRVRILRGSRQEDRDRADAEVSAAEAVLTEAEAQQRRSAQLFADGIVTAAHNDEARRNLDVAVAQRQAARKRAELVKAPPLPEEAAQADAEVRAAEERVRMLGQLIEKSIVRAPIDGTVLRTSLEPGESFSILVPRPILTLADTSRLRARAEVDERDVGRVSAGQRVLVRADGWADRGVPGRVDRVSAQMGRKTVRTGDPAEKGDRDVLEVIVDLDRQDPRLVVGLRVTALFLKQ